MNTILDLFEKRTDDAPDHVATHAGGIDLAYGDLRQRAYAAAAWLRRNGLGAGDRVALLLPNSPEYVALYLGILYARGIVVALNPESSAEELLATCGNAEPTMAVVDGKAAAALRRAAADLPSIRYVVEMDGASIQSRSLSVTPLSNLFRLEGDAPPDTRPTPEEVAQIIYTSGTTGRPKGVTLTHRNLAANCESIVRYLGLGADDGVLVALPFFYSYGNSLLFTHLACGGRLVFANDFVFWNRLLDLMQDRRVTGFSGVPSSFAMLLHRSDFRKRSFPSLRYLTCAGGALPPAVVEQVRRVVPHADLFLMYGQTEATARLSTLMPRDLDEKLGSIGCGIPGVELNVLDEDGRPVHPGETGEVVAKGDNLMAGYWRDPDGTRRVLRPEGLRTGDLARVDEDGYIFLVGRKNDLIKSGAHRIHPAEIEHVLHQVAGVEEVAVVGLPDPILGESPVAFVVASRNETPPVAADLLAFCRKHLPRHKHVREIRFIDVLPKTASGKIRRNVLRERVLV